MDDFLFWWSVVSTVLGIIFLLGNVAQFVGSSKEKEIHKAQVKVWQHHAHGVQFGLFVLDQGKYSTVDDFRNGVRGIQQVAQSLYNSLNEERLFTDKEVKEQQLAKQRETKQMLDSLQAQVSRP